MSDTTKVAGVEFLSFEKVKDVMTTSSTNFKVQDGKVIMEMDIDDFYAKRTKSGTVQLVYKTDNPKVADFTQTTRLFDLDGQAANLRKAQVNLEVADASYWDVRNPKGLAEAIRKHKTKASKWKLEEFESFLAGKISLDGKNWDNSLFTVHKFIKIPILGDAEKFSLLEWARHMLGVLRQKEAVAAEKENVKAMLTSKAGIALMREMSKDTPDPETIIRLSAEVKAEKAKAVASAKKDAGVGQVKK